jgi:hypothetical protein
MLLSVIYLVDFEICFKVCDETIASLTVFLLASSIGEEENTNHYWGKLRAPRGSFLH